jgi:hypothetical protein
MVIAISPSFGGGPRAVKGYRVKSGCEVGLAIAAVVVAGCGLFVVATTLHMVVLSWSPVPFWDQWGNLISGRSLTWAWLVSQWNEHRILVPRLIFWLDWRLAAETYVVDFSVNVLIQTVLSVLLAWLALKSSASDRATKMWAYGLSFAFLFWAVQYENFAWGFQVPFFGVGLAAAATYAVVAVGPETGPSAAAAAVLAGAAVYTLASGILVPALAFMLGVWVGRPRWYLLILLISAIGWPASYLWGYVTPAIHSNPADIFSHFGTVSVHFLTQLGSPFFNALGDPRGLSVAAILGTVGLLLFLAALALVFLRPAQPAQKALAMFAIYLLGAAFLTAAGRFGFGAVQALASRYATPVVAFWLSTFLLLYSASAFSNRLRLLSIAASVPLAILVASSELRFVKDGLDFSLGRKLATPALLAGVSDPRLGDIYPKPEDVLSKRSVLLTSRTSVFIEEWARLMGAKFGEHFAVDPKDHCSGAFLRAQMVDQSGSNWSAIGTGSLMQSSEPLRRIVLVNDDDRIVGYGLGGFDPSSVGEDQATPSAPIWWTGSFADADPSKVRAYAVLGGDHACLVGSSPRIFSPAIVTAPLPSPAPERKGHVDGVVFGNQRVTIVGWGYLSSSDGRVMIDTNLPILSVTLNRPRRPDVVAYLKDASLGNAGIEIRLFLKSNVEKKQYRLCVWTDDPKYGRGMLHDATHIVGQPLFACDSAVGAARELP